MQPNRRHHRTPFTATQYGRINDASGQQIALCQTPELARFLAVTASHFDDLTEALRLCRGEIHLQEQFLSSPGMRRILEIADRVERDLRGHD